jgi:hypothetical protein
MEYAGTGICPVFNFTNITNFESPQMKGYVCINH